MIFSFVLIGRCDYLITLVLVLRHSIEKRSNNQLLLYIVITNKHCNVTALTVGTCTNWSISGGWELSQNTILYLVSLARRDRMSAFPLVVLYPDWKNKNVLQITQTTTKNKWHTKCYSPSKNVSGNNAYNTDNSPVSSVL